MCCSSEWYVCDAQDWPASWQMRIAAQGEEPRCGAAIWFHGGPLRATLPLGLADYTCAWVAGVIASARPSGQASNRPAAGLTGSVSRWHRHSASPVGGQRRSHRSPNRALGFCSHLSKGNGANFAKRSVMVDRLGSSVSRIAGARPRRDQSTPAKRGSDPSRARACWSAVVHLDNGERAGPP